ncbi:MAG: hypothetical protein JWN98_367, partial [Abditibacteriota bacterium]|nr:hypothetical protein [Abditibacteriota bacterium]
SSLTGIIGPVIATELFHHFTHANARVHIPGIAFMLAAVLNVLALVIALRVLSRLPAQQSTLAVLNPATAASGAE